MTVEERLAELEREIADLREELRRVEEQQRERAFEVVVDALADRGLD